MKRGASHIDSHDELENSHKRRKNDEPKKMDVLANLQILSNSLRDIELNIQPMCYSTLGKLSLYYAISSITSVIPDVNILGYNATIGSQLIISCLKIIEIGSFLNQCLFDEKMVIAERNNNAKKISTYLPIINSSELNVDKITTDELCEVINSFRDFERQHPLPTDQHQFLKFLKQGCKIGSLLTLVKLGLDKEDCHIHIFEEADSRTHTRGRNSLLWLAAKKINTDTVSLPEDLHDDFKNILAKSKKYSF